jgi:CRP-like cAMP-binding protein
MTEAEAEKLCALGRRTQFSPRTNVFFQDDPSDAFYVLLSGSARVYQTSEDGHERTLRILHPGESFGELAMVEGLARSASVQTLQPAQILVFNRVDFETFCNEHPTVLWALLRHLAERLRLMNEDVLDMSFRDVPYRVLRLLSILAERHGVPGPLGWTISMPLLVKDLASMLGSHPGIVGRLLDGYETDGLLKRDGNSWTIPDLKALNRAVEYAGQ